MQPAMPPPRSPSRNFRGPQDPTMASTIRGNATHVLKRSFSTPSVGGVASTSFLESQPLAPQMNEKKRNKLGYHRTSIACGESCLPPFSDSTGTREAWAGPAGAPRRNLTHARSLPPTQNTLYHILRGPESMCQLYTAQERVQLSPGRPAAII